MKIIKMRSHTNKVEFKSVNETASVVLSYNNGPELNLEDNTVLIFLTYAGYYTVLSEGCIKKLDDFNLDVLKVISTVLVDDDVSYAPFDDKYNITHVTEYKLHSGDILYKLSLSPV